MPEFTLLGQEPVMRVADPSISTLGDVAANFSAAYGLNPDPWQRLVLDDWLSRNGKRWTHLTCGLAVPRQNGKNAVIEVREIFGAVGLGEAILHTAHEVKTAQKHFRRLKYFFGQKADDPGAIFPELNATVARVRSVNGQEAIFFKNGGSIELVARSKNSGRGFTVDVLVMDEAQELSDDALEALMPTTSSAPLGNPQWIYAGTPPGPNAVGEVFSRVRRDGISGVSRKLSWSEWSPPGLPEDLSAINLDDRSLWARLNPAITAGRLSMDVIEGERSRFSPEGFARERLGWWASDDGSRRLITPKEWDETAVEDLPDLSAPVRALGVVFSKDGQRAAVAGALHSRRDRRTHVEIVDEKSGPVEMGVAELAEWISSRRHDVALVGVSGRAGALALEAALRERKVPKRMIHMLSTLEYFAACSMMYDAVQDRTLTHPGGYTRGEDTLDVLDVSVGVCDRKVRTADGAWGWEATSVDGDEVPLEAVSVALWAARTTRRRPGKKQEILA